MDDDADDDCQFVQRITQKTPLLRYVFQCVVKRNVFSADLEKLELSNGSQRWLGERFQALGAATEKVGRPNLLQ